MEAITTYEMTETKRVLIEETMRSERPRLLNFIKKRVPTSEDAEDLLQDVFVQLVSGITDVESIGNLSSWLFTVTRNKITDWYRKKKAVPFSRTGAGDDDEFANSIADLIPGNGLLPDDEFTRTVAWEAIETAIENLPEAQREVFVLHEFEGWSFNDIAEKTGESLNTLLSRKHYAVKALRKELEEMYREMINE